VIIAKPHDVFAEWFFLDTMKVIMHYLHVRLSVTIWDIADHLLEEFLHWNDVGNMPDTLSMIPMFIPDPAFIQMQVLSAESAGNEHGNRLN